MKTFYNCSMSRNAFTLMELITVIVILGVVAVFAIPNYAQVQARTAERLAADNLDTIWQAVRLERTRNGVNPPDYVDLDEISAGLNLYMTWHPDLTYSCAVNGGEYECIALHSSGWDLYVHETRDGERPRRLTNGPQPPTCQPFCPWINYPWAGDR